MLPSELYLQLTRDLVVQSPRWDLMGSCQVGNEDSRVAAALDPLMPRAHLMGEEISNSEWNLNSVFPQKLYELNGCSLERMLEDKRLYSKRTFSSKDSWRSFFGYMATPSVEISQGMIRYWLESWRSKINRCAPYFYFKVTDAHWAFEELARNTRQPLSGRVATACLMGVSLIYESKKDCLHFQMHMRSVQWSHLYGDVFGGAAMARAFQKEVGVKNAALSIAAPKMTMDKPTIAKKVLAGVIDG